MGISDIYHAAEEGSGRGERTDADKYGRSLVWALLGLLASSHSASALQVTGLIFCWWFGESDVEKPSKTAQVCPKTGSI